MKKKEGEGGMMMIDPKGLIHKYCAGNEALERILLRHSEDVALRALEVTDRHPELVVDRRFLYEAAMLHDIGIVRVDAKGIACQGTEPYICHGILGAAILRAEGLPRHARVAERHTGTGLTAEEIVRQALPLPVADYRPETLEEEIVCYADKFYSKSRLEACKTPEQVMQSLQKFGPEAVSTFRGWTERFG